MVNLNIYIYIYISIKDGIKTFFLLYSVPHPLTEYIQDVDQYCFKKQLFYAFPLTAWVWNIQFSCMCYLQWKLTSKLVLIKVAASNMENISNRLVIMISHTHSFSISQCSSFMSNSPPTPHNWCLLRGIRCQVSTACMLSKY